MKTKQDIETLAKEYSHYAMTQDGFIAGYTACQEEDRWIPVSERPVKQTGYYICYIESTKSVMPMWNNKGQWYHVDSAIIHNNVLRPVTHYKPLPNPPKK